MSDPTAVTPVETPRASPAQKPSVGRIVHYWEPGRDAPLAAIITRVWNDTCVNLEVFGSVQELGPAEKFPTSVVLSSEPHSGRTWEWPPRA